MNPERKRISICPLAVLVVAQYAKLRVKLACCIIQRYGERSIHFISRPHRPRPSHLPRDTRRAVRDEIFANCETERYDNLRDTIRALFYRQRDLTVPLRLAFFSFRHLISR